MNNIIKFRGKIIDFITFPYDIKKIKKSLFNKHQNILIYLIKKNRYFAYTNFSRITDWYPTSLKEIYLFYKLFDFNSQQKNRIILSIENPTVSFYMLYIDNKKLLDKVYLKIKFIDQVYFRFYFLKYFIIFLKNLLSFLSKGFLFLIISPFLKTNLINLNSKVFFSYSKKNTKSDHFFGNLNNNKDFFFLNYDISFHSLINDKNHIFRNLRIIDFISIFFHFFILYFKRLFIRKNIFKKINFNISKVNSESIFKKHYLENFIFYNNIYDLILSKSLERFFLQNNISHFFYPFECKPQEPIFSDLKIKYKYKLIAFAHSFYNQGHIYSNYSKLFKNIDYLWVTGEYMSFYFKKMSWPLKKIINLGSPKEITFNNQAITPIIKMNKLKLLFIVGLPHYLIFYYNFLKDIRLFLIESTNLEFRLYPLNGYDYQLSLFEKIKKIIPNAKVSKINNLNSALNKVHISIFLNTSAAIESLYSNSYSLYLSIDTSYHNDMFDINHLFNNYKIKNNKEFVKKVKYISNISNTSFKNHIKNQKKKISKISSPLNVRHLNNLIL